MPNRKLICIDFDGVIHLYSKGWQDGVIYDTPVDGSMEFLHKLVTDSRFSVAIYSSRSGNEEKRDEMIKWLEEKLKVLDQAYPEGTAQRIFGALQFPMSKPAAFLTIDDRAFCFTGNFPSNDEIADFKTWKGI